MPPSNLPSSSRDNPAIKDAPRTERQLEKGVEDSFPASDPPSSTQPVNETKAAAEAKTGSSPPPTREDEDSLDEGLAESFPASDPPSMTQPQGEGIGAPDHDKPKPDEVRVADFLKPPR